MKINYKQYVEKNKRHIKLTALITGILIVIVIILLILLRLNFMIGEQLRMTLSPEYFEKNSTSIDNVSLEVDIQLYNKFVCNAVCNFVVKDLSHDKLLYNGSFNSKAYKTKHQSFDISLEKYGYGTNIYLYSLECINTKTTLCPSSDESLIRKSLLTVNYEPSTAQKNSLNYSLDNYALISDNIVTSSIMVREIGNIISSVNISFDAKNYSIILSELDTLEKDVITMLSIWNTNDYDSVKNVILSKNMVSRSYDLSSHTLDYVSYINDTINKNNLLMDTVLPVRSNLEDYRNILLNVALSEDVPSLYPTMNYSSQISSVYSFNSNIRNDMLNNIISGNSIIDKLNTIKKNDTKEELYLDIVRLNESMNNKTATILNATILRLSEQSPSVYIYSKILCDLYTYEGERTTQSNNAFAISTACNNYYAFGTGFSVAMLSNISNISDASTKLEMVCARSRLLLNTMDKSDLWNFSDTQNAINTSENESDDLITDSSETLLLQYKLLIDYESINSQNANYPYALMALYKNYVSTSLITKYNISEPEELLQGYIFNSSILVFNKNNLMLSDIKFIEYSCYANNDAISNNDLIISTDYDRDTTNIPLVHNVLLNYYTMPQINLSDYTGITIIKPPESVKQCCMYGKCQSCEKHSSKNPLILLHGHSFNLKNYAYQSIEIFNDFEKKFSEDKTYYVSGIPIIGKDITRGILGNYYVPVIIKPTYYVATYNDLLGLTSVDSKTENIDTYALRLSESIDYTLQITGSSKVDIVTHSMGGLVLRRYTQIFGTQKIGKVILIAAPNQGISSSIYAYCKVFGYDGECENMRSESIYMKKLNDYSNQPHIEELYLVIGKGCETDGFDSDGVVLVNNSLLSSVSENNILFVEGKCSGTKLLHNDLLDTTQYPEVYEFVKSKLDK
ncbi:MAG: alpha/beta fold hydrolase [Candidatus Woesearchaeota archaeon]